MGGSDAFIGSHFFLRDEGNDAQHYGIQKPPTTITIRTDKNSSDVYCNSIIVSPHPSENEGDDSLDQTVSMGSSSFDDELCDERDRAEIDRMLQQGLTSDLAFFRQQNKNIPNRYILKPTTEESSFPSKVSISEDDEDESFEEPPAIIRTLYKHVQKLDEELEEERTRRQSRERNLIQLAKELVQGKEALAKQRGEIEQMREALNAECAAKALLEERLESQLFALNGEQEDMCGALRLEVIESRRLLKNAALNHERRIEELKKVHAKQCEDLCKEVVETNRENKRLREELARVLGASSQEAEKEVYVGTRDKTTNISVKSIMSFIVLLFSIYSLFASSGSPPSQSNNYTSHTMLGSSRLHPRSNFAPRVSLPPESPFHDALYSQEAFSRKRTYREEFQVVSTKKPQTRTQKIGSRLKKIVVKEEGESRQMGMNNAFLKARSSDNAKSARKVTSKQEKPSLLKWIGGQVRKLRSRPRES